MSEKLLSGEEILKVAMNLEKEGMDIYLRLFTLSRNKKTKEVFKKLCDYEKEHFAAFGRLRSQIISKETLKEPEEIDREISEYLRNLINTGVFAAVKKFSGKKLTKFSEQEAVSLGIQIEKNSILYYTEVYDANLVPLARNVLSKIIKEERLHLTTLYKIKGKLED